MVEMWMSKTKLNSSVIIKSDYVHVHTFFPVTFWTFTLLSTTALQICKVGHVTMLDVLFCFGNTYTHKHTLLDINRIITLEVMSPWRNPCSQSFPKQRHFLSQNVNKGTPLCL